MLAGDPAPPPFVHLHTVRMRDHSIILRPYTYTTILRILAMEQAPEQLSEEELKRAQVIHRL